MLVWLNDSNFVLGSDTWGRERRGLDSFRSTTAGSDGGWSFVIDS